ncbi:MAG: hypothetical protein JNL83_30880 [Myxococcales bacterium]|nr:hypothetical protein [Myxococcales bacterium]
MDGGGDGLECEVTQADETVIVVKSWIAVLVVIACGCRSGLESISDLDVDIPAGWVRKDVRTSETQVIQLIPPGADRTSITQLDAVHISFSEHAGQRDARAQFHDVNRRLWDGEVTLLGLEETTLPDGWVAIIKYQTLVRTEPDLDVWSMRMIGGRPISCGVLRPTLTIAKQATEVCKSVRLRPK